MIWKYGCTGINVGLAANIEKNMGWLFKGKSQKINKRD